MTYKQLLEELQTLSPDQLNRDVTVYLGDSVDEYVPVQSVSVCVEDECDVLDSGSLVLVLDR
tara:strand:- start:209 stop:394 length:186 start_codon:yes stop_codon:yes gene_type:complete